MESVCPENVFQTLSLSPYSQWTLAPQLAPEHVEMLADYTTRADIQGRRRGGYSVICTSHNTDNHQRKFQTSLTQEESETLLDRHLIPLQAHPSLWGAVCPPHKGDNWSLWLYPPHLFPKCWMLAWCEVFCAACLGVTIHIFSNTTWWFLACGCSAHAWY